MMKITIFVSLMLIGTLWASRLSCDSCGSECSSACGTRRFRSCCFNYLRKKRGPDAVKFLTANTNDKVEMPKLAMLVIGSFPEMSDDFKPFTSEDSIENMFQASDS